MNLWVDPPIRDRKGDPWLWYYRAWGGYVFVIQMMIGLALMFGPERWREFNSLGLFHKYVPWMPWWFVSATFFIVGLGVLSRFTRRPAYTFGFLTSCFWILLSALYSVFSPPRPLPPDDQNLPGGIVNLHPNPIAIGLGFYAPLVMIAGIRFVLLSVHRKESGNG